MNALGWATVPATIDEAVFWLTRLLAHFPRRDVGQDAVVTADLAADMIEAGVSLVAIVAVCDEVRKAATRKDPWLPPSGEILKLATEKTKTFNDWAARLKNPVALAPPLRQERDRPPWVGVPWPDMPDTLRRQFWAFMEPMNVEVRRSYCRTLEIEYEAVRDWAALQEHEPDGKEGFKIVKEGGL